jgi:hypothetical protein
VRPVKFKPTAALLGLLGGVELKMTALYVRALDLNRPGIARAINDVRREMRAAIQRIDISDEATMAYSDYGGRVFRNGERVDARCDATLSATGRVESTPGQWPGFTLPLGMDDACYHALLGDGPLLVGLYKQSTFSIYHGLQEVATEDNEVDFSDGEPHVVYDQDGYRVEIAIREEDNHYIYCRLTQPDGAVWTGWSGYHVGAGFDDNSEFDSDARDAVLAELFPSGQPAVGAAHG